MASERDRPVFTLDPRGPDVSPTAIRLLARNGGRLNGVLAGGAVRTWFEQDAGPRVALMWPRTFRARLDPLEVLDGSGRIVAVGGEFVTVGGGYVKPRDPESGELIFLVSSVGAETGRPERP